MDPRIPALLLLGRPPGFFWGARLLPVELPDTAGTAGAVPRPRRSHSWRVRRPWAGGQMLCAGRPLAGQPAHEHAIAEGGPV